MALKPTRHGILELDDEQRRKTAEEGGQVLSVPSHFGLFVCLSSIPGFVSNSSLLVHKPISRKTDHTNKKQEYDEERTIILYLCQLQHRRIACDDQDLQASHAGPKSKGVECYTVIGSNNRAASRHSNDHNMDNHKQ